jgi:hypothetical protein
VGVRNRSRKKSKKALLPRGPQYLDSSGDPAPIFKQGRGKPSPSDEYLEQQRDEWIWLLESPWYEIGRALETARKPEDIREVFKILRTRSGPFLVEPFLRTSVEESTVSSIASIREQYEKSLARLYEANQAYEESSRQNEDVKRILFRVSEEFKKQSGEEQERLGQRVRLLGIAISRVKGRMRKYKLLRDKYAGSKKRTRDYTQHLRERLRKLETEQEADQKARRDVEERIREITPQNRKLALEELQERQELLESAKKDLHQATTKFDELQAKLLNQEAFFCQTQLLIFIESGKYALEPRKLASAIAGLPYLKARRSAERCASLKSSVAVALGYEVFLFIRAAWNRRNEKGSLSLVQWFKNRLIRQPKRIKVKQETRDNHMRNNLTANWYFLKRAIGAIQASKAGPRSTPYLIAQRFFAESVNPPAPTDSILAARDRITD